MNRLEHSIKKRYLLFISTIILIIIAVLFIIRSSINDQKKVALLINKASEQCLLNERMNSLVYSFDSLNNDTISSEIIGSFKGYINKFENTHRFLDSVNKQDRGSKVLDSLLKITGTQSQKIISSSKNIINNPNKNLISKDVNLIADTELPYFLTMQSAIREYQKSAEQNRQNFLQTIYVLVFIAILILIGEFLFVLVPALKELFKQNNELVKVNSDLAKSETKIKENLLELTSLKTGLEKREAYNKVFIEQAPTAIAMLDTDMRYLAVSQRWIADYKMENEIIIGRSHYDIFPEIGEEWKQNHQKCLNGVIDTCDEAPFVRADGTVQWIFWDVRPWYISEDKIGGLLMHTGDITHLKEKEDERVRIEKILDKTNEVARIGTWEIDLIKNTIFWSKVVFEIHEVPSDFTPNLEIGINFYKEGKSRKIIEKAINDAEVQGVSFDLELELVTFKGNNIWVRTTGQAEIVDGKCIRIYGVFQDITSAKNSEIELNKAHAELKVQQAYNKIFIEQAPTAIAMVDNNMCYIAVSQRWITDYKMEGQEFIGRSHYDLFPEIGDEWKAMHQRCLNGAIDKNDEEPFLRADGSLQWLYWDVRPWYDSEGNIGGILMQTGDITDIKENEDEKNRIEKILEKSNEVSRTGTWDIDLIKNTIFWSKMVFEIHETPEDFQPDLETAIQFFKEGNSRDIIEKAVEEAIENGKPYDVEVELVTLKGNIVWTRAIGQAEIVGGKCIRIFGVFQDINEKKLSQIALNKAHTELEAIFDSEAIAIVATNRDGIISKFNPGAEVLTGYSANEMIGVERPLVYHLREELDAFKTDIAKQYGKDLTGFNAQEELAKHNAYDTREWHYLRKDGSILPVQLTLTSIKDEKGKVIGFLGVSTDISEKRIAQEELLKKNQLLNFAEEITLMGNWQWDIVTGNIESSNNLYNIFNLDKNSDLLSFDTYFDLVHPDDKGFVKEYINKIIEEKSFHKFTHRIITADGILKTIEVLGEVITDNNGEITKINGTSQDITATKLAEIELNKAHLQLKAIFNSGPIAIVSTDNNGIFSHFNSGAEHLLGYSSSEMVGLKEPEIYHLEDELDQFRIDIAEKYGMDPNGFDPFSELAKRNEYDTREWTYKRKDGSTFPVELTLTAIRNEQDEKIGFLGVAFDITEKKLAENEILRKNQLLNFAEEISLLGNWQWDTIADKVEWSDNLYNIFGLDKEIETLSFDTYFSFVHPEDKDIVTDYFDQTRVEKRLKRFTHRIIAGNGDVKIVQLLGEVITDLFGNIIEMIGTCQDVTAAHIAEKELFDAHTQLKAIFNSGPLAIVSVDNEGIINHFNYGAEFLLGYSASEMIGLKKPDIYHLDEELLAFKEDIAKKYNKDLKGFSPYLELSKHNAYDTREWTYRRKDGTTFPVELTLTAIKNNDGEKIGFLAVANDISDRKITQNELLRKNQILNFAEEITLMGNWQADIINNTLKWSANLYRIFQLDESNDITLDTYLDYTHPEDKDRLAEHMRKTVENKTFTDISHRIQLKDGTIKIVQLLAQVTTNGFGDVTEIIGTCQDITAQKMAETELIRKNHFLSFAERITMMGNWQWDVVTDSLKWSSNLYKIFEHDESLTNLKYDTFYSYVHPEDKEYISNYVEGSFLEKKFPSNFIHRIITGSGKIKTVHFLGEVILNEQGEVIEMMGTCQDITEQKMEENKFRGLLESAPDAMVIVDENDEIQLINKEAEKLFGYHVDELIGERVEMLIPKRFAEMHNEHRDNFFSKTPKKRLSTERRELYGLNKEGKEIPIQISLSPLQTEQGLLLSAAIRDITAQKQAESEILRKNQLLTFAEKITMMGNWQWNLVTNKVDWSANLYNIFGVEENATISYDTYFSFVHIDDKEKVTEYVEKSINDKNDVDLMHRITLTDGTIKTIQLLAEVVVDSIGNVVEMVGTCQDVTSQRMAENKFRGLLESAPDAMVIVNAEGNIQLINKQAEKLFGYTAEELINKSVEVLIPKQFSDKHVSHRDGFFSNPKVRSMGVGNEKELFAINKSGIEIPIQISLSPLQTEEGLLISAAIRDITVQKTAQTKIINAKNDLEVLAQKLIIQNGQLADFAQITSHNLRAPVSNLNSLLGFYVESDDNEEKDFLFKKFEAVINHLTVTLNTLVEALKIRSDNSRNKEDIRFEDVLRTTTDILSGEILTTNTIIKADFSKLPLIKYDKIYLESIFLNLIGNAIKYRSKDRDPEISIKSENLNGKIKLTITDNGLGINLDRHGNKIFGLNKVFHRHPDAKGVGLYMTKTQIEAMGGAINVSSKVNKGTTFTITF
ncbi:PAS domain-containing sensor histidine kinase [Winogradskyella thalassocola]|uniref:histidine kinase n=1 Tax=Winogradskyella thalassocola TaxID=262004 RepID=A0A1G8KKH1_9FLAO|nr:PAS domain S-box protein [Winogradskyella thalassocola]SDI43941.1 PAS domain S-box-containing protein [Winogradskyella thalassocola]